MRPFEDFRDFLPGLLGALHGARLDADHLIETRRDGREQNLVIDRLDEIVVGAGLLADQNVVPVGQGRQEDERHVRQVPCSRMALSTS